MDPQNIINIILTTINAIRYVSFFVPIILLIVSILLWLKFGKNDKLDKSITYYPPKEMNIMDVSLLYNKKVWLREIAALLINLGNKKYIEVIDEDTAKGFVIRKLKDYDGTDENEMRLMDDLFAHGRTEVGKRTLRMSFRDTTEEIISNVNCSKNRDRIFESSSISRKYIVLVLYAISIMSAVISFAFGSSSIELGQVLIGSIFTCVGAFFVFRSILVKDMVYVKVVEAIIGIIFVGISLVPIFLTLPGLISLLCFIVDLVCVIGILLCYFNMPKRTKYGNEMLGKINGFIEFVKTCEKDDISRLLSGNPYYFYDVLPYVHVLGLSNEWFRKFEKIPMVSSGWYHSKSYIDKRSDLESLNTFLRVFQNVMAPKTENYYD